MRRFLMICLCSMMLFSGLSASVLATSMPEQTTSEQLQPDLPDQATTEQLYEYEDESLLQHQYIDKYLSVVTSQDTYYLMVKMYNLQLLQFWSILGMFVIYRVFEAFKPAYKVAKF